MHTITKLLLTYYLNISVQAANLSDCRIESKLFCLNWNALSPIMSYRVVKNRTKHYGH